VSRLRRVSPNTPGWTRRRADRGFAYADASGKPLNRDEVERVRSLAIPPAWCDVWICPLPNGHLQATGLDAAGRRQYLYHPAWRIQRDRAKFERVTSAAQQLPEVRGRVASDLATAGMPLARAAATAVRLLDLGYFRIGNDYYADANGSFGLTTLERRHVRGSADGLAFRFVGKSGIEHQVTIGDADVLAAVQAMRRRHGGERLLAYRNGAGWADLGSAAVNAYLAELFGGEFTAKDFRTWHAGVIAAEALARSPEPGATEASRRRVMRAAVVEVADYLGNTPAVARASYIDPRLFDLYESGLTIADALAQMDDAHGGPGVSGRQEALERAVLELLNR
jgi:DNA topoisomerase IB